MPMILGNRLYERREPDRDATLCIIYCEGSKREPQYFQYFEGLSSRVILEVVEADSQGDNSPSGLYQRACSDIEGSGPDSLVKYEVGGGDQVWFVIDTDTWGSHIPHLRLGCAGKTNWHVAQSNPCFEVWLYYHLFDDAASVVLTDCTAWKNHVNTMIPGGFNSRKHPIYIADAIANAERYFNTAGVEVLYGSTEMFKLGKALYPMVASAVEKARRMFGL
jgi:hypothetical protein